MRSPPFKTNLILIEDSEDDAGFLLRIIEKRPLALQIRQITDGEEALRTLLKLSQSPTEISTTLVIMDLGLPKISGQEILTILKDEVKNLPILVLTGSEMPADKELCLSCGAKGFYTKPWNYQEYCNFVDGPLTNQLAIE